MGQMQVCIADPWPPPGQASHLPSGKTQSHSKTQPSPGKTALHGQLPAERPSEVPARDKVTKINVCNLPALEPGVTDLQSVTRASPHSTDEGTEAQRWEETCLESQQLVGQSRN